MNHILEGTFHISLEQFFEHGEHLYLKLEDSINPLSNVRKIQLPEEGLNLIIKFVDHLYENICNKASKKAIADESKS